MKNLIYFFAGLVFVVMAALAFADAEAGGSYHHNNVTNNYYESTLVTKEYYDYSTSGISDSDFNSGLAQILALDAIHCTTSTRKNQMGVGTGYSDGKNGFGLGYCKTFVTDGGIPYMLGGKGAAAKGMKPRYNFGVNWTF